MIPFYPGPSHPELTAPHPGNPALGTEDPGQRSLHRSSPACSKAGRQVLPPPEGLSLTPLSLAAAPPLNPSVSGLCF